MTLWLDKVYAENFLMSNPCLLLQLSWYFMSSADKETKNENDIMNDYSVLALIAQLLNQTHKSALEEV